MKEDKNPVFVHPNNPSIRVIRPATVGTVEHIPIKLSYNPYLDEDYYEDFQQRRRDDWPEWVYCISDSWRTQGYEIKYLSCANSKEVFRRTANYMSALIVPQALLDNLLPDRYANEGTQMLRSLAKRCGF